MQERTEGNGTMEEAELAQGQEVEEETSEPLSIHDAAEQAWEELEAQAQEEEQAEGEEQAGHEQKAQQKAGKGASKVASKAKGKHQDEQAGEAEGSKPLDPPQGFNLQEKEDFLKIPRGQQEAVNRIVSSLTSQGHKLFTELSQERKRYSTIENTIKQYAPLWAKMELGHPAEAIEGMAKAHARIVHDPVNAISEILQNTPPEVRGQIFQRFKEAPQGAETIGQNGADPNNPLLKENKALKDRLSQYESSVNTQQEQARTWYKQEIDTVKEMKDSSGQRYLFPELHDDKFRNSLGQLISWHAGRSQDLPFKELLVQAYCTATGKQDPRNSGSQTQAVRSNNTNTSNAVAAAGSSLRGRTTSAGSGLNPSGPPQGLSLEETIAYAYDQIASAE